MARPVHTRPVHTRPVRFCPAQFRLARFALALALPLMLIACGPPSTDEALRKAENAKSKVDLEKALGRPTEIQKLGPIEQWTYKTSDGSVTFVIAGNTVTLASGGTTKKN